MKSRLETNSIQTSSTKHQYLTLVEAPLDPPESIDILAIIFSGIGKFEKNATKWSNEVLAREINTQALQAHDFCEAAIENAKSALLHAWACGMLLNTAKTRFGYGHFGIWRKQILNKKAICERTSQRYMLLATTFPDVEALLQGFSNLRQALKACRPSPGIPKIKKTNAGNVERNEKQSFLSSVAGFRESLRRLVDRKDKLAEEEKHLLMSAKAEIDEYFRKNFPTTENQKF